MELLAHFLHAALRFFSDVTDNVVAFGDGAITDDAQVDVAFDRSVVCSDCSEAFDNENPFEVVFAKLPVVVFIARDKGEEFTLGPVAESVFRDVHEAGCFLDGVHGVSEVFMFFDGEG